VREFAMNDIHRAIPGYSPNYFLPDQDHIPEQRRQGGSFAGQRDSIGVP